MVDKLSSNVPDCFYNSSVWHWDLKGQYTAASVAVHAVVVVQVGVDGQTVFVATKDSENMAEMGGRQELCACNRPEWKQSDSRCWGAHGVELREGGCGRRREEARKEDTSIASIFLKEERDIGALE